MKAARIFVRLFAAIFACVVLSLPGTSSAQTTVPPNYQLASGDSIKILVYQNPDMSLETRVSEDGSITYPLIGSITIGGLAIGDAEKKIAVALKAGGFLKAPQVNIQLVEVRGNTVAVLGQVKSAGSFPLNTMNTHVSQMLAQAGGVLATGDDKVIVTGVRDGKAFRRQVDIDAMYQQQGSNDDIAVMGGDTIYVPRAPLFYIYGEVSKPGNYRIERNMTMRQAIAAGGGLTLRGTERRLRVVRPAPDGKGAPQKVPADLDELVQADDVIYVAESLF